MNKSMRWAVPAAALGLASLGLALPGVASASPTATSYSATLGALNHVNGSGHVSVSLSGSSATIDETFHGLAASFNGMPYPHVQHIHGPDSTLGAGGVGQCPTMSADKNSDGIVDTVEGQPAYGPILTTLSKSGDTSPKAGTSLPVAPSGASTHYHRTINLDSATMQALTSGKAVVVVHGLDPSTLSKKAQGEKSHLVPSLPLAATSPALCGALTASQMSSTPVGSSPTGGGSTSGIEDEALLGLGGGLLLAAGGVFAARRRTGRQN